MLKRKIRKKKARKKEERENKKLIEIVNARGNNVRNVRVVPKVRVKEIVG